MQNIFYILLGKCHLWWSCNVVCRDGVGLDGHSVVLGPFLDDLYDL